MLSTKMSVQVYMNYYSIIRIGPLTMYLFQTEAKDTSKLVVIKWSLSIKTVSIYR